jgi:hypothetical protein
VSLARDIARCSGLLIPQERSAFPFPEHHPECIDCQRRTDRSAFPQQVWMGPPNDMPCPHRIPPQESDGQPS